MAHKGLGGAARAGTWCCQSCSRGVAHKSFNVAQWLLVSITLYCVFTCLMCFIAFRFFSFVLHSVIYMLLYLKVLNYSFSSSFLIRVPLFIFLLVFSYAFFPTPLAFHYSFLHFTCWMLHNIIHFFTFHGCCIIILDYSFCISWMMHNYYS